jgi:hypothetical protein
MWFLTQHKRWGWLKEHPDYLAVAKQINQIDLYKQAAGALKVKVPKDVMRSSKLMDGVVWDGKDTAKYADSFKVRAGAARRPEPTTDIPLRTRRLASCAASSPFAQTAATTVATGLCRPSQTGQS